MLLIENLVPTRGPHSWEDIDDREDEKLLEYLSLRRLLSIQDNITFVELLIKVEDIERERSLEREAINAKHLAVGPEEYYYHDHEDHLFTADAIYNYRIQREIHKFFMMHPHIPEELVQFHFE